MGHHPCYIIALGASLTQRINQVALERDEVAIQEELYARHHGNRADNVVI